MFTCNDFNTENAPKEMVQYIIDHNQNIDWDKLEHNPEQLFINQ